MRQEVELAKVEIKEEATKAGKASGMLAGAGAVGYLVLVFLALTLMFALDAAMPTGWAALITAVRTRRGGGGAVRARPQAASSRSTRCRNRPSRP